MKRMVRCLYLFALAVAVATGCSRSSKAAAPGEGAAQTASAEQIVHTETLSDTNALVVPHPEQFPLVAVRTELLPDRLSVTGVIGPDVSRTVPVNALGGGRVVEVRARLGDDVQKGQTLVVINSPDAAQAQAAYQHARADEALAKKQLDRAQLLLDHGTIARKDLEAAQNAEDGAQVDLRTTAEQLRTLGTDPDRPTPYIEVTAPISGTIISQNVTMAAGVKSPDNAPDLFTIADLSHVWLLCDVYENGLASVQVGARAEVHLDAYPTHPFLGTVGNIARVLDSATRTVKVRVELDNPSGALRVGMFATVTLVSPTVRARLVLPSSALLRLHDADWVFLETGSKGFRRVHVQAGADAGDGLQELISGLSAGDHVVRDALQFSRAVDQE